MNLPLANHIILRVSKRCRSESTSASGIVYDGGGIGQWRCVVDQEDILIHGPKLGMYHFGLSGDWRAPSRAQAIEHATRDIKRHVIGRFTMVLADGEGRPHASA